MQRYTSAIWDLVSLKKKATYLTCPEENKQEYLANYLTQKKIFYAASQNAFKIETALKEINNFGNFYNISTEKKIYQQ